MAKAKSPAKTGHRWRGKDGSYRWKISLGPRGHEKVITICRQTLKEREDAIKERLRELEETGFIAPKDGEPLFRHQWNAWLRDKVEPFRARKTYASYKQMGEVYILPVIGNVKASKVTAQHVQQVVASIKKAGLSDRTANYAGTLVFNCLGKRRSQQIREDVILPTATKARDRVLDETEVALIWAKMFEGEYRDRFLIGLILNTGLRISEALGLTRFKISFTDQYIDIDGQLVRYDDEKGKPAWGIEDPKTTQSTRRLYLNETAMAMVKGQLAMIEQDRAKAGDGYHDYALLFPTEAGRPGSPRNVHRTLQKLVAAIEKDGKHIEAFSPHDLRRTYLTWLSDAGNTLQDVKAIAGHASMATTEKHYIWAKERRLRDVSKSVSVGIVLPMSSTDRIAQ